ncbi:MAG: amino acid ABC transporter substrate-binding protein, partial [Marinobacter sp.]
MKKQILLVAIATTLGGTLMAGSLQAATLDDVKSRGHVQCGVTSGLPGFSQPDQNGNWTGLDVDTCRAVAAAVFGSAEKTQFTPLTA